MIPPTTAAPWERQFNESRKAYAAFCVYRDLGPGRSVQRASEVSRGLEGVHPRSGRWHMWATKWRWVERADQWDAHQEQIRREAEERALSAHFEKLAAEKLALQSTELDLHHLIVARLRTMLTWPLFEQTIRNEDGITIIKPIRWSMGDIARLAEIADKLARLALGMETERVTLQLEEQVRQIAREMAAERGLDEAEVLADVEQYFRDTRS